MSMYLVTGGAGFIGSHIVEELIKRDEQVRVLDNFCEGKKENLADSINKIELIEGDIRDMDILHDCCKGVDFILHQAALKGVAQSVEDPVSYTQVNVGGTVNMLFAAHKAGVKKVIFASSSSIYGDAKEFPAKEDQLPRPISPYAASKLAGEFYCGVFSRVHGLDTVCLRYFNVFGTRQDPASEYAAVIPRFITRMLSNKQPIIYGDGEQSRDFTYVDNVVSANLLACKADAVKEGVMNISCGKSFSILQLAEMLNGLIGCGLEPEFLQSRPGDIKKSLGDISKARSLIAYKPGVSFEDGLKRCVNWYKREV